MCSSLSGMTWRRLQPTKNHWGRRNERGKPLRPRQSRTLRNHPLLCRSPSPNRSPFWHQGIAILPTLLRNRRVKSCEGAKDKRVSDGVFD